MKVFAKHVAKLGFWGWVQSWFILLTKTRKFNLGRAM